MNSKTICLLLTVLCLSGSVFGQWTKADFSALAKLEGSWKMENKQVVMTEVWQKTSDTLMEARSYSNNKGAMTLEETVQLVFANDSIAYIVRRQGEGEPVAFLLISNEYGKYQFENKANDFPQRIIYHLVDDQHLNAAINGNTAKGFRQIDFPFVKEQ